MNVFTNTEVLIGKIFQQYGTRTAFAKAIGWSRKKVSKLLSGDLTLDQKEMEDIAKLLNFHTPEEFMNIFFAVKSQNGTEYCKEGASNC